MKMSKLTLAALLAAAVVSNANAADEGSGKIKWYGSIVDAPCSIKPGEDGDDQNINLGAISNVELINGGGNDGETRARPFKIELQDCSTATKNKVQVTFSGSQSTYDGESLGLFGDARGAFLRIQEVDGTKVKLNTPSVAQTLLDGNNTLNFQAQLVGSGTSDPIVPGAFTVPATFKLSYN